jgi:hypothetical protein
MDKKNPEINQPISVGRQDFKNRKFFYFDVFFKMIFLLFKIIFPFKENFLFLDS